MADVDLAVARVTLRAASVRSLGLVWIEDACFARDATQSLGYIVELHDVLMNSVLVLGDISLDSAGIGYRWKVMDRKIREEILTKF